MIAPDSVFLFALWSSARVLEAPILADLAARFRVIRRYEIAWPAETCVDHFVAFYAMPRDNMLAKAGRCGCGRALVVMVEDPAPAFERIRNASGLWQDGNRNVDAAKQRYRRWLQRIDRRNRFGIHSSVNLAETRQNFATLFGEPLARWCARIKDASGALVRVTHETMPRFRGWQSPAEFFEFLDEAGLAACDDGGQPSSAILRGEPGTRALRVDEFPRFRRIVGAAPESTSFALNIGGRPVNFTLSAPQDSAPRARRPSPAKRLRTFVKELRVARAARRTRTAPWSDAMPPAPEFYAMRNPAGRLLLVLSASFVAESGTLAQSLLEGVGESLETLPLFAVAQSSALFAECAHRLAAGDLAWKCYPWKRDELETVFIRSPAGLAVEKRLLRAVKRGANARYRQLALPAEPVYSGESVADRLAAAAKAHDWDAVYATLEAFFAALRGTFGTSGGTMPGNLVDAVPRNSIVDAAGEYRFFDLEYNCRDGVRESFLVYRALLGDVLPHFPRRKRRSLLKTHYARLCSRLGVAPDFARDDAESRRFKRFLTASPRRRLARLLLHLPPFAFSKRLRARLAWWSPRT